MSPPSAAGPPASPPPAWAWLLGFLVYASFSVGALLLSGETKALNVLASAGLNALPELLAGPLTLRLLEGRLARCEAAGQGFPALPVAGLGAVFIAFAVILSGLAPWLLTPAGRPVPALPPAVLVWRGAMAFLVFSILLGLASTRLKTRQAQAAALRAERADRLRARAELAALRSQLDPHFVLNVLHSLIGLTGRQPARAAEGLERLGALLRSALRVHAEKRDLVPLGEEVEITRQYLEIERLRLGSRLRVGWRLDEEALSWPVPPFSLQPLAENAVRHAVAPRAAGGHLRITVGRSHTGLRLAVEDDGAAAAGQPGEAGLGHDLLSERLRWLYGERARLTTGRRAQGGYAAEVSILANEDDEL